MEELRNFNRPRMLLGKIEVVPLVSVKRGVPITDRWVLPGGEVVTTNQAKAFAQRKGWTFHILK